MHIVVLALIILFSVAPVNWIQNDCTCYLFMHKVKYTVTVVHTLGLVSYLLLTRELISGYNINEIIVCCYFDIALPIIYNIFKFLRLKVSNKSKK